MVHKAILSDLDRKILKKVLAGADVSELELGAYRVLKTKLKRYYPTFKHDFKLIKDFMEML